MMVIGRKMEPIKILLNGNALFIRKCIMGKENDTKSYLLVGIDTDPQKSLKGVIMLTDEEVQNLKTLMIFARKSKLKDPCGYSMRLDNISENKDIKNYTDILTIRHYPKGELCEERVTIFQFYIHLWNTRPYFGIDEEQYSSFLNILENWKELL